MSAPAVPAKIYVRTFAGLLALTLLTVLIGFVPLGEAHMAVAVGIAMVKAALIALFFMHVKVESHLIRIFLAAGIFWFVIMISLTLGDYVTRPLLPVPPAGVSPTAIGSPR